MDSLWQGSPLKTCMSFSESNITNYITSYKFNVYILFFFGKVMKADSFFLDAFIKK